MLLRGCQSELPSVPSRLEGCQSLLWRTQCLEALPADVGLIAGDAVERGGLIHAENEGNHRSLSFVLKRLHPARHRSSARSYS